VTTLPAALRFYRLASGLSFGQLAIKAGLSKYTVKNAESGKHRPTLRTIQALARALGVRANELMVELR
jgi:transcriptional regulator with XRE-family HTH domain